jgi:two-component system response regulator
MTMTPTPRSLTILVVEDDPGDQLLIQEAFAEHGASSTPELVVTEDGRQALDFVYRRPPYADARRPDLVLLDLNLPKYDGRAVLRQIKSDPALRAIPVIIFSTSTRTEDIIGTYQLHANAYVNKPMNLDDFTAAVKHVNSFFTGTARLPDPPAAA